MSSFSACILHVLLCRYAAAYIYCNFVMLHPHSGVVDNIIFGGMTPCSLGSGMASSLTRDRVDRHTCPRCVERTELFTPSAALLFDRKVSYSDS